MTAARRAARQPGGPFYLQRSATGDRRALSLGLPITRACGPIVPACEPRDATAHRAARRAALPHTLALLRLIKLGNAKQSSFGVAFKRETGLTPMQWRTREAG